MTRLRLDGVSVTLPGRASPFSLAGMLPAFCLGAPLPILDNVALDLADGERLALLGASGAGKTSLLRVLSGQSTPAIGAREAEGSVVAIVDVESRLDLDSTGEENLARLAGEHFDDAKELAGLGELLDVPVRHCSPGMRWRLGFAGLAARPADVVLIDDCVRQADLAFRPMMMSRLNRMLDRSRIAVVAEPMLMVRCNRFTELVGGRLESLESPARAAA